MSYVDTGVLVAALTNEARTASVQKWLAGQPPEELAISDWVVSEFSSALSMKLRMRQLDPEMRAAVLAQFKMLQEETFTVWPITREAFRAAARMADAYSTGLRAGDALHLAVAANHGAQLVSLDKGLVDAALALGISARLL